METYVDCFKYIADYRHYYSACPIRSTRRASDLYTSSGKAKYLSDITNNDMLSHLFRNHLRNAVVTCGEIGN